MIEDLIKNLINVAKIVDFYYDRISFDEANYNYDIDEFENNFGQIEANNLKEKKLLNKLSRYSNKEINRELVKYRQVLNKVDLNIDAPYYRVKQEIEGIMGDDLIDYSLVLQNDVNTLIFKMLKEIINDEKYLDIRALLLRYKYKLIYLNCYTESNYLIDMELENVSFEADSYRTLDMPSYIFVDKSVLVLDIKDRITNIITHSDIYQNSLEDKALMVINIINVLARLTLCCEEDLNLVYDEVIGVLNDDNLNKDLYELWQEMFQVLANIKNQIKWSK